MRPGIVVVVAQEVVAPQDPGLPLAPYPCVPSPSFAGLMALVRKAPP